MGNGCLVGFTLKFYALVNQAVAAEKAEAERAAAERAAAATAAGEMVADGREEAGRVEEERIAPPPQPPPPIRSLYPDVSESLWAEMEGARLSRQPMEEIVKLGVTRVEHLRVRLCQVDDHKL